jgi:hypothetical protein
LDHMLVRKSRDLEPDLWLKFYPRSTAGDVGLRHKTLYLQAHLPRTICDFGAACSPKQGERSWS